MEIVLRSYDSGVKYVNRYFRIWGIIIMDDFKYGFCYVIFKCVMLND